MDCSACCEMAQGGGGPFRGPAIAGGLKFVNALLHACIQEQSLSYAPVLQPDCGHVLCIAGHSGAKADQRKLRRFKAQAAKIRRGAIELLKQQKRNLMARPCLTTASCLGLISVLSPYALHHAIACVQVLCGLMSCPPAVAQ